MKITHKVTVEKDFIDDIICNSCGQSCIPTEGCGPEGITEITVDGGYGSNVIGDGDSLTFSICEGCLVHIVMDFAIAPVYSNQDDVEPDYDEWRKRATSALDVFLGNHAFPKTTKTTEP